MTEITIKNFDSAFLDVRSPQEFEKGAIPGAVNIPILNDQERKLVGTCYVKKGAEEAIKRGHQLVNGKIKEERVTQWADFVKRNSDASLYCARGGLRSQIAQQWLKEADINIPRVQGGYKALRNYLLKQLTLLCPKLPLIVLSGKTGGGKTTYLKQQPYYIDLEALANHRGSAFGSFNTPQPTTMNFENELALLIIKLSTKTIPKIMIEDESFLIGKLLIPPPLYDQIMNSPVVVLQTPLDERVNNILNEYILDPLKQGNSSFEQRLQTLKEQFLANLKRISKKLGGSLFSEISNDMQRAFETTLKENDNNLHKVWIEKLLTHYYDPRYDYSLVKHKHRIIGNCHE
ncbi:tRNA 2-selenouridine(34) synthase MnmH [bacterium]|nr:tRNA 2-selenouridine(34) synthase MnmH [bacterium]